MNQYENPTQSSQENGQDGKIENQSLRETQEKMVAIEDSELPVTPLGVVCRRLTNEVMNELAKTPGKDYSIVLPRE